MSEDDKPLSVTVRRPKGWAVWEHQLPHVRKRFESGNPLALYDAILCCQKGDLPMPDWLAEALRDFVQSALTEGLQGQRGKGNSAIGRQAKSLKRRLRADAFWTIRNVQKDRNDWIGLSPPVLRRFLAGEITNFGRTREEAAEAAQYCLEGTFAEGTSETIMRDFYVDNGRDSQSIIDLGFVETMRAFGFSELVDVCGAPRLPWFQRWLETGEGPDTARK